MTITQEDLKKDYHYDPSTGLLTRIFKNGSRRVIQTPTHDGYLRASVKGKGYRIHRLAWLYVYGYLPSKFIDHINGDPLDNRIVNLRESTDAENKRNVGKRSHNTSGFKGVTWDKTNKKWMAHATLNGKGFNLGRYTTPEAAAAAYDRFARQHHGPFYKGASV